MNVSVPFPVVPSGLARWVGFVFHGLTPMATSFRHFVAVAALYAMAFCMIKMRGTSIHAKSGFFSWLSCEACSRRSRPQLCHDFLVKNVTHVEFDIVLFKNRKKLFFKTSLAMMLGLIADVVSHGVHLRFADRKRGVARLPFELSS